MAENTEVVTCQRVLSFMVLLSFMIHHTLRINMSIAIVEMVYKNNSNLTLANHGPRFEWNEKAKNDVLGFFFWGYIFTQVPGGRLSEVFGAKKVVGFAILLASILTICTPFACHSNHYWLITIRFVLGVVMGVHWPSAPSIATKWISSDNTSVFLSHMAASSLGIAIALPICGYIIAYLGWPSVFYITGSVSFIWSVLWFYLIYDSPDIHPRISAEEKERLRRLTEISTRKQEKLKVPWRNILTSGPVWAFMVANSCSSFSFFLVFNQMSTYMSQVLAFNIKENGWFSSLPFLVRYFTAILSSYLADKLKKTGNFSTTTLRKIIVTVLFWGLSLTFAVQACWGYHKIISVIAFTVSLGLIGLVTPGVHSNCIDISPSFAGTIFGISQVFASFSGYMTTKIVALLTYKKQTFEQWSYVFWICVGINMFASIVFIIFASGKRQKWNSTGTFELEQLQ